MADPGPACRHPASLAGYGFAKFRFPGRSLFFFAIVGILMVPFQSVVVPLYLWVSRFGLLDTYLGILAPDLVSVFGVFLMRQAIEVVPSDYIDAARIDGAGELGIFWRVILPTVGPALATLVIIKFMWTWNELFWPLVVVNSPSNRDEALRRTNCIRGARGGLNRVKPTRNSVERAAEVPFGDATEAAELVRSASPRGATDARGGGRDSVLKLAIFAQARVEHHSLAGPDSPALR